MESPRKFNDCYFYYYSTCTKGDNCVFRHEPSALGCETMCSAWQQGKCLDKRCKLRHMELRKNRKQIPCYWENQPGGCRKIHCPFMHKNPEARTDGIAPSQPQLQSVVPHATSVHIPESVSEQPQMNSGLPTGMPAPQPVPLLWQQQRQVVLDSAILGVLPGVGVGGGELLGARRVLPPHEAPQGPYAQLPVDPLVVNFEEESDNESAPSSTPTKVISPDDAHKIARTKSQELLLLEKIQAEAAAFYGYDTLPLVELPRDRMRVRTNLSTKYERQSSDETGKKPTLQSALDFKVLSLDEIRARKKNETLIQNKPITLNLNRKRKLSETHETITTSGNKILKVVRSNSVVYKKLNPSPSSVPSNNKVDQKSNEIENVNRKRTLSEQNIYETQENELVDNCFEFKRIKLSENIAKPKLIRHRLFSNRSDDQKCDEVKEIDSDSCKDNDSDTDVQIVGVDDKIEQVDITDDVIDLETSETILDVPIDIVDLSEDQDECTEITISDLDLDLTKNVPDVVASCQKGDNKECNIISAIDSLLDDDDL